ncbi:MAG TPA: hypothetical protein VHT75_04255 [Acidimicrobiales bacterium]|jgi:hypothetical protein|nr:hypothetical protein [Acidimicrobiales bacterium]
MSISGWGIEGGKVRIVTTVCVESVHPAVWELFDEYVIFEPPITWKHLGVTTTDGTLYARLPLETYRSLEEIVPALERVGHRVVRMQRRRAR